MATALKDLESIWDQCLAEIQKHVPPQTFSTWFKPIVPLKLFSDKLIIQVPSRFHYEWIEEHYCDLLDRIFLDILGYAPTRHYTVSLDEQMIPSLTDQPETPELPAQTSFLPEYETRLNARYTFENFVEGSSNQFAKAAALAVAENPGKTTFNPLLIYGGVGLGKTHLIQAIGNYAAKKGKAKRIRYVSSEKFTLDFINAIQNNRTSAFSQLYRNVDLLLVDDIQFFANKERTQEEFFHTFNELQQKGKQIVLSSDRPPSELKGLEERLISRFNSGLIADIQVPDFETRVAILQRKAEQDNIQIPTEVTIFLASNITTNVRDLEGALIKLLAHASLNGEDISLNLAKRVLKDIIKRKNTHISIETIQRVVADYYGIKEDLLRAKTRKKEIALARQLSMYLAKEMTNFALKTIGLHFGGRDHSTVIHACQTIEKKLKKDRSFAQEAEEIKRKIELSV
jgi:chromosomal replication initiator protein